MSSPSTRHSAGQPFIPPTVPPFAWKRGIDVAFCLAALPLLVLLSLWLSIQTKLVAPGPLFFRQERIGRDGRPFTCFKFRTMVVGEHSVIHQQHCEHLIRSRQPMTKMDARGDSRLMPGGWLLRASGLDELPQVINILRGEMSLVGPRPCMPYEYERYKPWQCERFSAQPGLTGLWQVSGKNTKTFEEMVCLDIDYARNVSLRLDLKIILMTPPTLFLQILEVRNRRSPQLKPAGGNAIIRT